MKACCESLRANIFTDPTFTLLDTMTEDETFLQLIFSVYNSRYTGPTKMYKEKFVVELKKKKKKKYILSCILFSWQASLKRVEQTSGFVVSAGLKMEATMDTAANNFALVPVTVILSDWKEYDL